jgi:hypothetical protein
MLPPLGSTSMVYPIYMLSHSSDVSAVTRVAGFRVVEAYYSIVNDLTFVDAKPGTAWGFLGTSTSLCCSCEDPQAERTPAPGVPSREAAA